MIDSHCHLADTQFSEDLSDVLKRAKAAGIHTMVTIADSIPEAEDCVKLAGKHKNIFCTVGVHPHNAKEWKRGDSDLLKDMVSGSKKVRAIGEIGLDYHYDHSPRDTQRGVFLEQLTLSRELGLPAVVHSREAIKDVETIIREVEPLQVVIHCCTEKWDDVAWLVELGHFLSFTGIATYAKSKDIHETIKNCPLEQMMIETDSPYLAPEPHRGKRNEPAYVVEVAKHVAKLKDVSVEEVEKATTKNAMEFFGLPN